MTDDAALDVLRAAAPANADTLDDLRDRLSLASAIPLVPFVGAGLSQPMGFPLWRGFLEGLAGECGAAEETRGLLDAGEFESAAEAVELALSPELFHRRLAQRFGKRKSAGCALRGPMLALPSLPVGPVVTTNFDSLLERVFEESGRPLRVCAGAQVDAIREAIADNQPILLKLHGSAEERTNRILTRAEYERHYGTGDPGNLRAQLAGIFQGRRLLFLQLGQGSDDGRASRTFGAESGAKPFRDRGAPAGGRGFSCQAARVGESRHPAGLVSGGEARPDRALFAVDGIASSG
jgi:hypothetical protein